MSSASLLAEARQALEAYLAGRAKAERVVVAVGEAYYREAGDGRRVVLRPVIEVIERAAPGVVALGRTEGGAGFEIKLAERPFPKGYETALKEAVVAALAGQWGERAVALEAVGSGTGDGGSEKRETGNAKRETGAAPGFFGRMVNAVRRLFSASA